MMKSPPTVHHSTGKSTCSLATSLDALQGKVAVVTGANSGMGYASALKLAESGAKVWGGVGWGGSWRGPRALFAFIVPACQLSSLAKLVRTRQSCPVTDWHAYL
jgi:hypothetical protein